MPRGSCGGDSVRGLLECSEGADPAAMPCPVHRRLMNVGVATSIVFANKAGDFRVHKWVASMPGPGELAVMPRCFHSTTEPMLKPPPASCSSHNPAVFSIFNFHFTYALTLIHTVVTLFGMQLFLRVRRQAPPGGASSCLPFLLQVVPALDAARAHNPGGGWMRWTHQQHTPAPPSLPCPVAPGPVADAAL